MRSRVDGAEFRAQLTNILKAAGDAGATCSDVAAAAKLSERNTRWHLAQWPGLFFKAQTKCRANTRWFHPGHMAAGQAYVTATDAVKPKQIGASDELVEKVLAAIKGGETKYHAAEAVGCSEKTASRVLKALVKAGRLQAALWPFGLPTNGMILHYWPAGIDLPETPPKLPRPPRKRVRVRPKKPKVPKPGRMLLAPSTKPAPKPAAPVEIVIPANVKRTVGPSCLDTRHTVTEPTKFFSAPGYRPEFIGQETWAAKVYGGGV